MPKSCKTIQKHRVYWGPCAPKLGSSVASSSATLNCYGDLVANPYSKPMGVQFDSVAVASQAVSLNSRTMQALEADLGCPSRLRMLLRRASVCFFLISDFAQKWLLRQALGRHWLIQIDSPLSGTSERVNYRCLCATTVWHKVTTFVELRSKEPAFSRVVEPSTPCL